MSDAVSLTALANKYGSDKGTTASFGHNYTSLYDLLLSPLRMQRIRLLEIGLAVGGPDGGGPVDRVAVDRVADAPSIAMWLDYFPYAEIVGFDISDFSHIDHPRVRFIQGDLGSRDDLARLAAAAPQFDIIIDDGSHASYHQQLALDCLFDRLSAGGLYVIEDLHWQPPVYEPTLPPVPKTAEVLRQALVRGEAVNGAAISAERLHAIRRQVQTVSLFPSFNNDGASLKLAVLRKTVAPVAASSGTELPRVRSYDLFDTLVARRCFEPHAVFREVERRAACRGFTAARIAAEARLYGTPYTLDDIYRQLAQDTTTDTATIRQLRDRELAVEREMLFPIAEHCASFATGDIVVSDMYLPGEFLHEIVTQTCRLSPSWLFVAAEGKRNGRIWPTVREHCTPVEHLGDNEVTDLQSASLAGIPARLTTIAQRTAIETDLAAAGYEPLANLIREARLRTWSPVDAERQIQRLQIQVNFPLLFVATLLLAELAAQRGWRHILFSGRDCYLWYELYRAVEAVLGATPAATYFYTSRTARAHPSPDYIAYFRSLYAGDSSVVVDLCGTGWSANRLLAHASGTLPDIFLLHHLDQPNIRNYYERNAAVVDPLAPLCCLHRGIINQENEVLEELNRAPHPLVTDVVATSTGFQPVFMPTPELASASVALRLHHAAFRDAITLLSTLRPDQVAVMRHANHPATIVRIYQDMQGQFSHVAHFGERKRHEEQIFQQFIEQHAAMGAGPDFRAASAPAA